MASTHNTRVAAARKLLTTRARAAAGMFLAEGPHAVGAALASARYGVAEMFVTPSAADRDADLVQQAVAAGVRVTHVTDRVVATLSDTVTPQGVVAVVRCADDALADVAGAGPRLVVVLVGIADPGNAGAVIRTADAAGADAVVLAGDTVDPHNPKCVRASAGSLFHLPLPRAATATAAAEALRGAGLTVLATALDGGIDLYDLAGSGRLAGPVAWMFGNEAHGLAPADAAAADLTVRIPIHGRAESLNLAAAAAVCLYATAQAQHRPAPQS